MNRLKSVTFGAITLAALAIAVPAGAVAAKHLPGGPESGGSAVAYGSVTSTGTGSFVLTTEGASGTPYTIATTADTRFVAANTSDNATFQSGDAVYARGSFNNGFSARTVWYDSAPFALPGGRDDAKGTGVSNTATQLIITDRQNNTDTFPLNSDTRFSVNGRPTDASSVPSVMGDNVEVQGAALTDGSLIALRVAIKLPRPGGGK